jgi:hypothetical protein
MHSFVDLVKVRFGGQVDLEIRDQHRHQPKPKPVNAVASGNHQKKQLLIILVRDVNLAVVNQIAGIV